MHGLTGSGGLRPPFAITAEGAFSKRMEWPAACLEMAASVRHSQWPRRRAKIRRGTRVFNWPAGTVAGPVRAILSGWTGGVAEEPETDSEHPISFAGFHPGIDLLQPCGGGFFGVPLLEVGPNVRFAWMKVARPLKSGSASFALKSGDKSPQSTVLPFGCPFGISRLLLS